MSECTEHEQVEYEKRVIASLIEAAPDAGPLRVSRRIGTLYTEYEVSSQ